MYLRLLETSDGLWGEGIQPVDDSKAVTIRYLLTIGGFRNDYYILGICGGYDPPETCPKTRTGELIGETREERIAELIEFVMGNALKETEEILAGKKDIKAYSIDELFRQQLLPKFRQGYGKAN
ncbi:MAG: hypothetical protein ACP5E4_00790 [Candidatus Aenigmatarchaeota archaeon]